jgi:hypothetical protein
MAEHFTSAGEDPPPVSATAAAAVWVGAKTSSKVVEEGAEVLVPLEKVDTLVPPTEPEPASTATIMPAAVESVVTLNSSPPATGAAAAAATAVEVSPDDNVSSNLILKLKSQNFL